MKVKINKEKYQFQKDGKLEELWEHQIKEKDFLRELTHFHNLLYYDGPLSSIMKRKEDGKSLLLHWLDCDQEMNRWISLELNEEEEENLIKSKDAGESLRKFFSTSKEKTIHVIDTRDGINTDRLFVLKYKDLPPNYVIEETQKKEEQAEKQLCNKKLETNQGNLSTEVKEKRREDESLTSLKR